MDLVDKLKMAFGLKTKAVQPKIYCVALRSEVGVFTSMNVNFSLEAAQAQIREDAAEETGVSTDRWKLAGWSIMTLENLLEDVVSLDIAPEETVSASKSGGELSEKNVLMNSILKSKDRQLYEKHKGEFLEHEQKFLEDNLRD